MLFHLFQLTVNNTQYFQECGERGFLNIAAESINWNHFGGKLGNAR